MADEIYSSSYWGNGVCDNTIDWGVVYKDYAGCTPSFTNTYSLAFDGVDDYLETTKTAALTTASLSMWVKVSGNFGVNERQSLASNDDFNHGRDFIIADTPTTTNDAYIAMFAGGIIYGKTSASGGIPINDGNWHHLVWTYDGTAGTSASINMYVDGQNQYSNASYSSYWSYEIKFQYFGKPTSANTYFSGSMDEVAYFNSILSASDVTSIYNSGVPNDLTSLNPIVWLRNGDNGTWKSPQWLIPNNINVANSRFSNYSFDYDGISDYINTGSSSLSGETALTISAWVYPTSYGDATAPSFVSTDEASPRAFYLGLFNGTNFRFSLSTNGTSLTSLDTASSTVTLNAWQHILVTWNQVDLKFYKNGVLLKTVATTSSSNGTFTTTNDLLIGARRSSAGFFEGNIDEVAVWNSVQDASTIYNSGTPTTITGAVAHWKMGEEATFNTNWTVPDQAGSNTGTSVNMTIENRVGDASNSSNNALSYNQVEADRKTDTPS
jgi:hypothetical protein